MTEHSEGIAQPNSIDAIPPREQWGTMVIEGLNYQDGQDRIFDVPFTRKELEDLKAVYFANQYLRNLAYEGGHEIEKKWVSEYRPMWGYSLLDRTVALRNIRKAATTA